MSPRYQRILLKLSGEVLAGESGFGIHPAVIRGLAEQIRDVVTLGVQVGIVVGGGNVIRGHTAAN